MNKAWKIQASKNLSQIAYFFVWGDMKELTVQCDALSEAGYTEIIAVEWEGN